MSRSHPHLRAGLRADLGRGLAMATFGCATWAPVEYLATMHDYAGHIGLGVRLRLAALVVTLVAVTWLVLAPLAIAALAAPRLWAAVIGRDATGPGWLAWQPVRGRPPARVAAMWAAFLAGALYLVAVQRVGIWALTQYKEKQRIAFLIAVAAIAGGYLALCALRGLRRLFAIAGELLYPTVGPWTPITSWPGAVVGVTALIVAAMVTAMLTLPDVRPDLPWRSLLAIYGLGGGAALGAAWSARAVSTAMRRRRRRVALIAAAALAIVMPWTLLALDQETKGVAVSASPPLDRVIGWVRVANDFDGDGFGSLLGENDCAPFDKAIHPGVRDIPDDGIDQNCDGRDFSLRSLAAVPQGEHMPVPEPFKRDWNVLLLTIDATRYDHTTFGGYADGPKHRDTTPNLAKLAARATVFNFANAAAPGTMASVPAIISSKFFHSGLGLDEKDIKPGMPPRLAPNNTLLAEIMKRGHYTTGAILPHEYFLDWGMEQGFDEYDAELGKNADPFKISSNLTTDRVIAWISRHPSQKWFLWAHYLDPHGRYVAHPDDIDWDGTEEDKYDSEIFYTDKHIGRLLDELARMPGGDHTIVVITSDHGDGFMEHGYINHGQALNVELLHVPLIFYVPDNEPRRVDGAVSGLDIVPTIADLCGIDVSDLQFEGRSLVPQIFYGRADMDRIVFSETNWPKPLRSATSAGWKLIYNLQDNLYELFDLKQDPGEKQNVASQDKAAFTKMKEALDAWLERVLYARDASTNQLAMHIADVLLTTAPTPPRVTDQLAFDDGKLVVLGWETESTGILKPGDKLYVKVYFAVKDHPSGPFKLQLEAWPVAADAAATAPQPGNVARSPLRMTLDGMFPTDRWRPGEFIRERFGIIVPAEWKGQPAAGLQVGLWMSKEDGTRLTPTGPTPSNDPALGILGGVAYDPGPAPTPPAPPPGAPPIPPVGPAPLVPPAKQLPTLAPRPMAPAAPAPTR